MTMQRRRRRARIYRLLQSWPWFYLLAAIVGFIICVLGWSTGRFTWIRFGIWLIVPLLLLLGSLVTVLTISAILNLGILSWRVMKRVRDWPD